MSDISRLKERCENYLNEFKDNYNLNLERGLAIKNQGNLIYSYEELPYILEDKNAKPSAFSMLALSQLFLEVQFRIRLLLGQSAMVAALVL